MPKLSLPEDTAPRAQIRFRNAGGGHGGGGAWKVAYADFVTALMAMFIVLWLMNSSTKVKSSISGYFRDPRGFTHTLGAGPGSAGEGLVVGRRNVEDIRKQLESALRAMPEFDKLRDNVKFSVTGEGLRIDLLENDQGMFFVTGSPAPTASGQELLSVLAREIGTLPNSLVIEGHTDASPFRKSRPTEGYSNWELAADRANAARRLLHSFGVRAEQVVEVRGYADQQPFNEKNRFDARNRRVSVVVKFPTA
jgi:chemotaxis protein MotB